MENQFGVTGFIFNNDYQWEKFGEGIRRKILGYEKDLMLVAVEFTKDAAAKIHKHLHKQISYIVKGSFEVTINNEKKIMKAGDVFLILPNLDHGVTALEDSLLVDVFTPHREDFIRSI